MICRRRFLTIAASMAAAPALGATHHWNGYALGAQVHVALNGLRRDVDLLMANIQAQLIRIEHQFSLYNPTSQLVRLNDQNHLEGLSPDWITLLDQVDRLYMDTGGLFDPSIQTLWHHRTAGRDSTAGFGWNKVQRSPNALQLVRGQRISLNGIAQGYATDMICDYLRTHGATDTLVNIGEHAAIGGPFQLGLEDPDHGLMGHITLNNQAVATSSPNASSVAGQPHIMHPNAQAQWSTVSVTATNATLADGLSTALTLAHHDDIRQIVKRFPEVTRIVLVEPSGDLITL
ncbi:FAD:protein FMN transferase [Parasulfitobacter algicola]|uniref:FAD:protein FMN transferase n=1 Tax=Parasulfitobacter algicola TaxID=2614809 RepID=A0ABX2ITH9_9RHOB|nr:FAD:protein FMN transferase [Sulfitobacter algicola]NSX56219.1 FAD:protein FMN transferase [Sulfitobacter algicola]